MIIVEMKKGGIVAFEKSKNAKIYIEANKGKIKKVTNTNRMWGKY